MAISNASMRPSIESNGVTPPLRPPTESRCSPALAVEIHGPRLEQLAALARELRAVVRRPN